MNYFIVSEQNMIRILPSNLIVNCIVTNPLPVRTFKQNNVSFIRVRVDLKVKMEIRAQLEKR